MDEHDDDELDSVSQDIVEQGEHVIVVSNRRRVFVLTASLHSTLASYETGSKRPASSNAGGCMKGFPSVETT